MADQCTGINSNPDIAGIGTRINFYVTILVTAFTPQNEYTTELLDGVYKSAILYGFSLVMTAVIQSMQRQLDLYHAIFVMQIIFSLDFVYAHGQRRFIRSESDEPSERDLRVRMKLFIGIQAFSTAVFTVWLLYVWIKDSDFGSQPECNHLVKYVLLFADVRATVTWLRVLFIMYLIVNACTLLFRFGVIISVFTKRSLRKDIHHIQDKVRDVVAGAGTDGADPEEQASVRGVTTGESKELAYMALSVVSGVYGVATLELIVARNRPNILPGEDAMGFGQIIALVLILGNVIDVVMVIRERRRRKDEGHSFSRI